MSLYTRGIRTHARGLCVCFVAVVVVGACRSNEGAARSALRGTPVGDPVASATWHLLGSGVMQDIGWSFDGPSPHRPPADSLQVHILDEVETAAVRRAFSKLHHPQVRVTPELRVPPFLFVDGSGPRVWRIPVHKNETRVRLVVNQADADPKYYHVDLRCDGEPFRLKAPLQGALLVFGFPTNAALVALIQLR